MAVHTYFTAAALLLGVSAGGTLSAVRTDRTSLLAAHEALVGVEPLCVALVTQDSPQAESLIDSAKLRSQILAKLKTAGIRHVEAEVKSCPRLVVQIENVAVPDCDKCVCRVQASVNRMVTFTAGRDLCVEADVWRLGPAVTVVTGRDAGQAISGAALAQVGAFIDACTLARTAQNRSAAEPNEPSKTTGSSPQTAQGAWPFPFVASKSASVFHRADCRWAQNISEDNRLGYMTREEALQSGRRPCKLCKP
ncbi:MAG: hypothetical protein JW955_03835 [Sedimentisphaerales bacterium]|nr:hypothetical protein [Sedimentisphaerales bacterium]